MYIWLLFSLSPTAPKEEILAYGRHVKHILPEDFSPEAETVIRGNQILLVWTRESPQVRNKINPGVIRNENGDILICSGYAANGLLAQENKNNIFSLLTYDSDTFSLGRSPGGIASYAFLPGRLDEAFCWSTQPPGYPTFVAKQYPHFCVAGNRPSLVCSASFLSHGLVLDRNYFHKYLSAGFAVDATTPYTNTFVVPPYKSLLLKEGNYRYIDYPLGIPEAIPGDEPLQNKAQRLADLLVNACWPASKFDCAHLMLSGGKDSRIIAATLYAMGAKVSPHCLGTETEIAEDVAAAAHFSPLTHEYVYRDACPIRAAISCNKETDGLGIAHAHQFTFRFRYHERSGTPIFHGNGHLLRGGNARTMQGDAAYLQKRFMEMFSPWVTEETFSEEKIYLEN